MAKGELKCLDETGELWLVRREDPGYPLLAKLPKDLYRAGAVLPSWFLKDPPTWHTATTIILYEKKIASISNLDDPDLEPVLVRLVQLVACLRALRDA